MANKAIISTSKLTAIGNAIRSKNGASDKYTLDQMATAIKAITTGITPEGEISIDENGTVDVTNFATASVNVPITKDIDNDVKTFVGTNPLADEFVKNVTYTSDYLSSKMEEAPYSAAVENADGGFHDRPDGYAVTVAKAGKIYVVDEDSDYSYEDNVTEGTYTIYDLIPNHNFRWYVISDGMMKENGRLKATGTLRQMQTTKMRNVRDLGGLNCDGGKIKYGLLFRGSRPTNEISGGSTIEASAWDIKMLHDHAKIRQEVDLRGTDEVDFTESVIGKDVNFINIDTQWFAESSVTSPARIKEYADAVRACIESATYDQPVYFHCSAGADRTAIIGFLLESILGVSQSDMDKDYELTSFYTKRIRTRDDWKSIITTFTNLYQASIQINVVKWLVDKGGISLALINKFRQNLSTGEPEDIEFITITKQPANASTKVGGNVDFTIAANGKNLTYLWEYNPKGTDGSWASVSDLGYTANASTLSITSAPASLNGYQIRCTVTDGYGLRETSNTCTLEVVNDGFTVTYNLSHCSSSNTAQNVAKNGTYETTITPDQYYDIDTLTVTMGGVDVTSSAVSGGVINISSVTGNIVITNTAHEKTILEQIGYEENKRISTSSNSGILKDQQGCVTTGYLPVESGKYVVTGIDLSIGSGSYDGIEFDNSSKTSINHKYITAMNVPFSIFSASSISSDKKTWTFTFDPSLDHNVEYIRFSAYRDTSKEFVIAKT